MELDITGHITMLYYTDLAAARAFYGDTLKLPKFLENEWMTLYQVTPKSLVGTIQDGSAGGFHKARRDNAVMLSMVTNDVAAWYERLKSVDGIDFIKPLYDAKSMPIKAFLITDPGGYTVEFFQWNEARTRSD